MAYRQAPALRRAIPALERSVGHERLEILVVDCGSQDETSQIDTEFPSVTMLRLPHHLGAARAMNIATRTAKAELLLFVSPDVEVSPEAVNTLADRLDADETTVAACPLLLKPDGSQALMAGALPTRESLEAACRGEAFVPAPIQLGQESAAQESVAVPYAGLEALMVRKQFIRAMNFFDGRFGHYWVDADLAMQIRGAGKKIRVYPAARAVLHDAPDPLAGDSLAASDKLVGAAAFLSKYQGSGAGFGFRVSAVLRAVGRFDLGQASAILGGSKLDGGQAG